MLCQMIIAILEPLEFAVLGPVGRIDEAIVFIKLNASTIDVAILDVNLHGEMSYPVAEELSRNNIPFVFATGYDAGDLKTQYRGHCRIQKPYQREALLLALS